MSSVLLHAAYLQIVGSAGRAREVPEVERLNDNVLQKKDCEEAQGVMQVFLKGLGAATKAVLEKKPADLDGLLGDHNCHVAALRVAEALQGQREEAQALAAQIKSVQRQFSKPDSPASLVGKALEPIKLSEKMQYLAYLAILKQGTVWVDNPDGTSTRKIEMQKLTTSIPFMSKLVAAIREILNRQSVGTVCQLSGKPLMSRDGTGPLGERFTYPCTFDVVSRVFRTLAEKNVPLVFAEYRRGASVVPLVFMPEASTRSFKRVDPTTLPDEIPAVVVRTYFNQTVPMTILGERLENEGVFQFLVGNAASISQFEDRALSAANEDLDDLSPEKRSQIAAYRQNRCDIGEVRHVNVGMIGGLR